MRTSLILAALCAPHFAPVFGQDNPITNGGFEGIGPDGVPTDWQPIASFAVETKDVHSGARALRLRHQGPWTTDPGLNRRWGTPGQRDAMLAQTRGGIRFWYKVNSAEPADGLRAVVIPMGTRPREVSVGRTSFVIPSEHVGDGQWHQGAFAYDYSARTDVECVHVGLRLYADNVDIIVDDFEWVPEVGPVPQPVSMALKEVAGREGEECDVTLTLQNVGDTPATGGTAELSLPPGLTAEQNPVAVPEIPPQGKVEVRWRVTGRRNQPGEVTAVLSVAGMASTSRLALAPKLDEVRLEGPRSVIAAGRPVIVALIARNTGTAFLGAVSAELIATEGINVEPMPVDTAVAPSTNGAIARWRVMAMRPTLLAQLTARIPDHGLTATARFAALDAAELTFDDDRSSGAYERDGKIVIGNGSSRLVLAKHEGAWAFGFLQCSSDGRNRPAAVLPRLGLLATADGEAPLTFDSATLQPGTHSAHIHLTGVVRLGGTDWDARLDLDAAEAERSIGYRLRVTPRQAGAILALEGPMLYAGGDILAADLQRNGSLLRLEEAQTSEYGRADAIVPGLDWLERGEASSSALDFRPEHPDRNRTVPHPYKVTIPAVGMRFDDLLVGLLWDVPADQRGAAVGPLSLVLSSPNRLEGQRDHLMGLMLPAAGMGMPENSTRATELIPVAAGRSLEIRADLLTQGDAKDALFALDYWFKRHSYPEPLPYPRGSARDEVAFSLRGYFKDRALWNPDWGAWYSDLIVGFRQDRGPAQQLLIGSRVLGEGEVAEQARALAAEVMGGDEGSLDRALEYRASPDSLRALAAEARNLIASQNEDGTWRFSGEHAGKGWTAAAIDYDYLGADGASEVGLTAPSAATVLEYALLTGDDEATAAGLKALRAMRTFRVPRAAQVWECPVHSPDIYASSRAIDACLLGYELTGDRKYLDDAVYWARTGLPFVYVWSAPGQPAMQGASIPIFGATSYVLSWLGVAVQWNGMAYAESLRSLAAYDDSFPWLRVAENLLRSGQYQQATEGDRLAQWPDAMNFIEGRPGLHGQTPPCFQPSSVLLFQLDLHNWWHHHARIRSARRGDDRIALRSPAVVTDTKWTKEALAFTATHAEYQTGAIEVIGVTRPEEVRLNGEVAPEPPAGLYAAGPGWVYHDDVAVLEILGAHPGRNEVLVRGVDARHPNLLRRTIEFEFDRDGETDGWRAANDVAPLLVEGGELRTTTTGPDPYIVCNGLAVPGAAGDVLAIAISSTGGDGASVYFGNETGGCAPSRSIALTFPHDGALHWVRVPVGDHAEWADHIIAELRIDPASGDPLGDVAIDSVQLERGENRR